MLRSRRLATLVIATLAFVTSACTKSEADLREEDRPRIDAIIEQDLKASRAMAEADDAARKSDLKLALEIVDQRATPAIDTGLTAGANADPRSNWGRAHRNGLVKILEDRKRELPAYTTALKSKDPEQLLEAMEAQAKIERRALAAVAAVREGR